MKKVSLFLFSILLLFNLTACSDDVSISNTSNGNSTNQSNKKNYLINEDVYITNNDGEYRLKITGISETSERNEFSDTQAERVIVISYEYENISLTDDLYITDWDFKVYDADNNVLESYPVDVKYPDSVGSGRKANASMAFALNNSNNYIELEFYDNMWNSSSDCIFKLEW